MYLQKYLLLFMRGIVVSNFLGSFLWSIGVVIFTGLYTIIGVRVIYTESMQELFYIFLKNSLRL
ncbi:MAG: hypothetical protein CM15mP65_29030 [Crocinitomicaceae bacterium]|nr:MAG: hypothetical protein CM15mP65_29030 [Crocinitomicaceae bacterium]